MKKWMIWLPVAFVLVLACNNSQKDKVADDPAKVQLVEDLKAKLTQNPDSASVRMLLINTLDSLKRYDEAVAQTDSMIQRDSANNGLWFARGQLLESKKDTSAAIFSYEKALNIYPSVEAQLSLANLFAETKNKNALAICQNVSKMKLGRETDSYCNFIAGIFYARTGNQQQAVTLFDKAIGNNYMLMEAYMEKGFVYYESKKFTEALQVFETAANVNPMYADAYYWRAKTFEAKSDKQQALENYKRALQLDKQLVEAENAIKRLS